jgi:hypothetical protein
MHISKLVQQSVTGAMKEIITPALSALLICVVVVQVHKYSDLSVPLFPHLPKIWGRENY